MMVSLKDDTNCISNFGSAMLMPGVFTHFSHSAVVRWCNVSHESYDMIISCDLPYGVVCVCPLVLKDCNNM